MDENPYPLADRPVWDYYRESVSFRWNGLLVTVNWCQIDDQWEAVGVAVDLHPDAATVRPLQKKDLDSAKWGEVLDYAAGELGKKLSDERVFPREILDITTGLSGPNPEVAPENVPKRRGRPPLSLDHLREVAQIYDDAYRNRRDPTEAVQTRWGLKKNTAASRIFKARKKGLLPPATRRGQVRGHGLRKPREESS